MQYSTLMSYKLCIMNLYSTEHIHNAQCCRIMPFRYFFFRKLKSVDGNCNTKLVAIFLYHRYYLKRIHQVKLKPGLLYGDRFLVDLELGIKHKKGSYRFSEHVYQKKGSSRLCSPKGLTWNKAAIVYFVLPVKDQGEWIYHFINEITAASLLTEDENFHVIVVDFESRDISISQAFDTDLLRSRHTIVNMTGKFYKTLALNKAVEHVPSEHDLLFLFDLHIDVPADIMDSVRKVILVKHLFQS